MKTLGEIFFGGKAQALRGDKYFDFYDWGHLFPIDRSKKGHALIGCIDFRCSCHNNFFEFKVQYLLSLKEHKLQLSNLAGLK